MGSVCPYNEVPPCVILKEHIVRLKNLTINNYTFIKSNKVKSKILHFVQNDAGERLQRKDSCYINPAKNDAGM